MACAELQGCSRGGLWWFAGLQSRVAEPMPSWFAAGMCCPMLLKQHRTACPKSASLSVLPFLHARA